MAGRNGDSSQRLSLRGPNQSDFGYGRMAVSLREALAKRLTIDEFAETNISAVQPDMVKGWYRGQRRIILTMWETDTLPPKFLRFLPDYELVLVPCLHNMELFGEHHNNVHVVPLGVDRGVWHPIEREANNKFKIFCGGSNFVRKGLDVVLEVFNRLGLPDAELHIKIVPPFLDAPKQLDYPNVVVHRRWMSLEDEVDLVRSCDLFVAASRGEGFGLMPLQAISCGIPTVVTDAHGHREFSDLATHRISHTMTPAVMTGWDQVGNWYEPNRDELADSILDAYNNRDKYRKRALVTASQVDAFSWASSADQLIKIVKPSNVVVGDGWELAGEIYTDVRVKRRVQATIGRHTIDLAPGKTHRVVLNVKDVLEECGLLA